MPSTRFSLSSNSSGFTVLEFLVSSFLGVGFVALVLASILANRTYFKHDIVRTKLNQNLRGALDIIGADVRLAGENLGSAFPAVLMTDGTSGASDTLIIRRNLLSEVLPVCTSITAGSNVGMFFATAGVTAGCVYSGHTSNYNAWRNYRLANGGRVDAYIWNNSTKQGEFFEYSAETDTGTTYSISRIGAWANNYPTAVSSVYILEEWKFLHSLDELRLVKNDDNANPEVMAFDTQDFQVSILMRDGSTKSSFTTSDLWTELKLLKITLTATDSFAGQNVNRSLTGNFFPRNVLSN